MKTHKTIISFANKTSLILYTLSKVILALLVLVIFADIVSRNLNISIGSWPVPTAEYSLLFITFLSIPYITQNKGHIVVQFLRLGLPKKTKDQLETLVYLICILISLYLGLTSLKLTVTSFIEGSFQYKTFNMPDWLIYLPISIGFIFSSIEWIILFSKKETIYN